MPLLMLANYWKPIAIAVALAAVFAYRAILIHQRDAARAETASLTMQVADLKSAEAACEGAATRQNAAVNALPAASAGESSAPQTRSANDAPAAAPPASNDARPIPALLYAP